MRLRALVTLTAMGWCLACGEGASRGGAVVAAVHPLTPSSRDSAGVQILEHPADAIERAPVITMDSVPIAVIGQGDTLLDLSRVYAPLVLADGRVAAYLSGGVHLFSPAGAAEATIGRSGSGPGEFRDGRLARGLGDTLLVGDPSNSRVSWVVPRIGVVRARPVKFFGVGTSFGVAGQFAGDTLLFRADGYGMSSSAPAGPIMLPVGRMTVDADSITRIIPLLGPDIGRMRDRPSGGTTSTTIRYSPFGYVARWGGQVMASRSSHWALDRYDLSGKLVGSVRVLRGHLPITAALRERDLKLALAFMQGQPGAPPDTAAIWNQFRDAPYADSLPSFSDVTISAGGIAWVKDAGLYYDSTRTYTAVAQDGRILGRLSWYGMSPLAFGDDRVVLKAEDGDGVVTFRVMRLHLPK